MWENADKIKTIFSFGEFDIFLLFKGDAVVLVCIMAAVDVRAVVLLLARGCC